MVLFSSFKARFTVVYAAEAPAVRRSSERNCATHSLVDGVAVALVGCLNFFRHRDRFHGRSGEAARENQETNVDRHFLENNSTYV